MRMKGKHTKIAVWFMAVACLPTGILMSNAYAQEQKGMDTVIPSLCVEDMDIREVLTRIAGYSGINFNASKVVKGPVTCEFENVTVREALDVLLKETGLIYIESESGIVRIFKHRHLDPEFPRERYYSTGNIPVDDLLDKIWPMLSKNGSIKFGKPLDIIQLTDSADVHDKIGRFLGKPDARKIPTLLYERHIQSTTSVELNTIVPSVSVTSVDIRDLLTSLAGYSGTNFNCSKEVKGPVTVELADVTVRDVLDIVLKDNGFNYIESESGIVRVLTQEQWEREMNIPTQGDPIRLIPKYISVVDFAKAFFPLLSDDGIITVIKRTNTVLVQDVAEVHAKVSNLLPQIDVQDPYQTRQAWDIVGFIDEQVIYRDEFKNVVYAKQGDLFDNHPIKEINAKDGYIVVENEDGTRKKLTRRVVECCVPTPAKPASEEVFWKPGQSVSDTNAQELKGMDTIIPSLCVTDIDLREVLTLIAGYSGINFNASKEVKGPVTCALKNVTVREALDVLLKDNGFNYIESESGIVRVISVIQYQEEMNSPYSHEHAKRYIPTYVTVKDFESAFRPLLSENGKLTVVKSTNIVVIEDTAEVNAKISSLLPKIDVPSSSKVEDIDFCQEPEWEILRFVDNKVVYKDKFENTIYAEKGDKFVNGIIREINSKRGYIIVRFDNGRTKQIKRKGL